MKGADGPTAQLIAYYGDLFRSQVIGEVELSKVLDGLKNGRLPNPIGQEEAESKTRLRIHRDGIENLVRDRSFDLKKIREWIESVLKNRAQVRGGRDDAREETSDQHGKIYFYPVPPRKFEMVEKRKGNQETRYQVKLTHTVEVMSTPLTQGQWVDLFGENPSKFVDGDQATAEVINGKTIKLQPDNPVEQITWWSSIVAANKLSEKHGLKPAYDTSGIVWQKDTSAGRGTLRVESGELKINAPDQNIYLAEGYRLPTEAEQVNCLLLEQQQNGAFNLILRAWFSDNAKYTTHPVALLRPLLIGGGPIYDLAGNVLEWSQDWLGPMSGGVDPVWPMGDSSRVARGGAWVNSALALGPHIRFSFGPRDRDATIGVRFVRTRHEKRAFPLDVNYSTENIKRAGVRFSHAQNPSRRRLQRRSVLV